MQRELDLPLAERTVQYWQENTSVSHGSVEAGEYDDFFSTMLLGVQPQRTCLSYIDGAYRECLLSGFDSNKKVLYATIDGKIVGRAFLRLTKGRTTGAPKGNKSAFTFVDVERIDEVRKEENQAGERVVLFLERPYTSGIDQKAEEAVKSALVDLACQKAEMLDAVMVLSGDYRSIRMDGFAYTKFYIYISRSKAGAQYLDSLAGEAQVDREGSYNVNTFLVKEIIGAASNPGR